MFLDNLVLIGINTTSAVMMVIIVVVKLKLNSNLAITKEAIPTTTVKA